MSSVFGRVIILLGLFAMCLNLDQGICGEKSVPETAQGEPDNRTKDDESEFNIGAWLVSFFSEHISAVDGDRCPSSPTCSSYSAQAFRKHGFFMGWLMTVDRLIHEGDEASISPVVKRNGLGKTFDPVENNDFWWYSKCREEGEE